MTKTFAEILIEILKDIEKSEREEAIKSEPEKCVEVIDRDITFGIRDRLCDENSCGLTGCPLFINGKCIGNHRPTGIKVNIPVRIIDAEAEGRKENNKC